MLSLCTVRITLYPQPRINSVYVVLRTGRFCQRVSTLNQYHSKIALSTYRLHWAKLKRNPTFSHTYAITPFSILERAGYSIHPTPTRPAKRCDRVNIARCTSEKTIFYFFLPFFLNFLFSPRRKSRNSSGLPSCL